MPPAVPPPPPEGKPPAWSPPPPPVAPRSTPPPVPDGPVRWGLGDVGIGFLLAYGLVIVVSVPVLAVRGTDGADDLSLAATFLLQLPLWAGYAGTVVLASRWKGNGVVRDFGVRMRWYDVPAGAGAGIATQLIAIPLLYLPLSYFVDLESIGDPARELTDRATTGFDVVVLVLLVVIGAPVVEELFFRGLLLRSLERRFGTVVAVLGSALVFGAIHFQLLQLPALALFGLVAAVLTVRTGRLGPAIFAHVAFNAVTVVILLAG